MASELQLLLPARAENVIVIRQALAGVAEAAGLERRRIADLKTVVTEACNNVVVHAYNGADGPMEVEAAIDERELEVTVTDRGVGFQPTASDAGASLGIGLPLVASLSDRFSIRGGSGGGTSLSASFSLVPADTRGGGSEPPEVVDELRIAATPGEFAREVLARVIGTLAARAQFPVERLSDTVLLGDAVSDHRTAQFRDERVVIAIADGDGTLDIKVGPLKEGGGERLLAAMDIPEGGSLRALARSTEVEREGDSEYLVLEVAVRD